MSDHLVSHTVFVWIISLMTGVVAGTWFVYDALKLWWMRKEDGRDPTIHDKRFGYSIGIFVGAIGVLGILKYHLW